ncbi:MAG: cyclomaltodextrinase C-terminal domain-containing protein, partial [Gammaproteobacteria bacterium]
VHDGKLMQFTPIGNVYAYFRYDDEDTVMVIFNRGEEAATVKTGRFAERIGDAKSAIDVITGNSHDIAGSLTLAPHSVLLLEIAN